MVLQYRILHPSIYILNIGVLLLFFVPDTSRTEFLVHELIACCHHQIHLECHPREQIVIVQARYIASESFKTQGDTEIAKASKTKDIVEGFPEARIMKKNIDSFVSRLEHKDPNFMSLSDIDLHFLHEMDHKVKYKGLNDLSKLNTPEWARQIRKQRQYFPRIRRYTTIPPSQLGLNFTRERLLDIPVSKLSIGESKTSIDRNTLWNQALFPIHTNSSTYTSKINGRKTRYGLIENENEPCYSYESINEFVQLTRDKRGVVKEHRKKPQWHYKDLRTVFNNRCSGKTECTFNLHRNKLRDQEVTNVCLQWPDGRIVVKYICLNPNSSSVYTKCNQFIENSKREGGFIFNPGYPRIYYGDEPCEWRIKVQDGIRILLLLLDISMRPQENSVCRDKLVITENHTKKLSLCKESPSAIAIVTISSSVNISLIPDSRFAYPKRGFLLYFRALANCELSSLQPPLNSYIISHNASHALIRCLYGYQFPDLLTQERWVLCDSISTFNQSSIYRHFPYSLICKETNMTSWNNSYTTGDEDTAVILASEETLFLAGLRDIIIPVTVIGVLFIINAIILLWIQKRKTRYSHEFENELNQGIEEGNLLQTSTEISTSSPTCSQGTTATASLPESKGNIERDQIIQEYYYCPRTNKGIVTNVIDNGFYYSKVDGIPDFSTSHEINNTLPSPTLPTLPDQEFNREYYYGKYFPRSTAV